MKYKIITTSMFRKEYKKINKQNKDLSKIKEVIEKLANGEELDYKYRDHQLISNIRFENCRECHIEPDWLLIYRRSNSTMRLYLMETGSHSDLFY